MMFIYTYLFLFTCICCICMNVRCSILSNKLNIKLEQTAATTIKTPHEVPSDKDNFEPQVYSE